MNFLRSNLRIIFLLAAVIITGTTAQRLSAREFLIVLDPGHGGHDPGSIGRHAKEKDICLSISNKVKKLLSSHKNIKVEATRTTDCYVTLTGRANKGNKSMCDLFVSIHCNSLDKSNPRRNSYCGTSVYTMSKERSDENLAIVKQENSVIELDKLYAPEEQQFDDDEFAILSELNQTANIHHSVLAANLLQKQLVTTAGRHNLGTKKAGFLVLRHLTRPSVLIEVDFLCNPTVEKFLSSDEGQSKIAKAIANGVIAYKDAQTTEGDDIPPLTEAQEITEPQTEQPANEINTTPQQQQSPQTSREDYRIQFLTSPRKLSPDDNRLKGLKPVDFYTDKNVLKYTYGSFATKAEASAELRRIRRLFPDAFVIHFKDGKRIK